MNIGVIKVDVKLTNIYIYIYIYSHQYGSENKITQSVYFIVSLHQQFYRTESLQPSESLVTSAVFRIAITVTL